jgi:hypothetical protein
MDDLQVPSLMPWQSLDSDSLAEALEVLEEGSAVSLDFRYCNIRVGPEVAAQLAMWLSFNVTLTSLDLGDNSIGDEGAAELAEMLEVNTTLCSLQLRNNDIGVAGAMHLAEALMTNTTLSVLEVGCNSFGLKGIAHFAEALEANCSLASLRIADNRIGDAGAKSLAEALGTNCCLTSLDVGRNYIGVAGARHFAEALRTNATLVSLDLAPIEVGDDSTGKLAEALEMICHFLHMNVAPRLVLNVLVSRVFPDATEVKLVKLSGDVAACCVMIASTAISELLLWATTALAQLSSRFVLIVNGRPLHAFPRDAPLEEVLRSELGAASATACKLHVEV